jgi:hypothetical protein
MRMDGLWPNLPIEPAWSMKIPALMAESALPDHLH